MVDDEIFRCCVCGKKLKPHEEWTKKATGETYHRECYLKVTGG